MCHNKTFMPLYNNNAQLGIIICCTPRDDSKIRHVTSLSVVGFAPAWRAALTHCVRGFCPITLGDAFSCVGCPMHFVNITIQKGGLLTAFIYYGTPEMIRTSDARFRKPTLYPLSYGGALLGLREKRFSSIMEKRLRFKEAMAK